MLSPQISSEDMSIIPNSSQNKFMNFYQVSSNIQQGSASKFFTKRKTGSRVLTSQTHIRSPSNLMSPLSRLSSKSIVINFNNRPLSTANNNRSKDQLQTHVVTATNLSTNYTRNKKLYKNQKILKSAMNQLFSIRNTKTETFSLLDYENNENNSNFVGPGWKSDKISVHNDDVFEKLRQKFENNKKTRENFKKQFSFSNIYNKTTIDNSIKVFLSIFLSFLEKSFDKFALLPMVEADYFSQLLDLDCYMLKLLEQFYNEFKSISLDFEIKKKEFQKIEEELSRLKQKNNEILSNYIEKISLQNRKDLMKMKVNVEKYEIVSSFENIRLEKELAELQKGLEDRMDVEEISQEFKKFKDSTHSQLQQKTSSLKFKDELLNKFNYQINALKIALVKSEKEIKILKKENSELQGNLIKKREEILIFQEKQQKYKEIAQMQLEETEAHTERNAKLMRTIQILNEKLIETKKKIGQNVENIGFIVDSQTVDHENALFKEVSTLMTQKFARILSKYNFSNEDFENLKIMGVEAQLNQRSSIQSNHSRIVEFEDALNQIILPKFQYNKPSFLSFIENGKNIFAASSKNNKESFFENKISAKFFGTLRGILDSKYNEFIYYQDYKSFSKFPEFVYSWLSTYELDEETRLICELSVEKTSDPNQIYLDFLSNLYHPLSSKLWECQNFKEFLEEKGSNDELYFFLHCRFILNKGATLLKEGASFTYVHYVLFYYAETVVDLILKHFDEETKGFIKARLREKAKGKNKKLFIDVSYVLKILLEYYRLERKQKFQTIKDLFRVIIFNKTVNNNSQIKKLVCSDFPTFKMILEKISNKTTELEKAELFRECWQIGDGEITPEIFFTVLTESNFFIYTLKLRSMMNLSVSKISERLANNVAKTLMKKDNYLQKLDYFNEQLKNEENANDSFKILKKEIVELGIERLQAMYDFDIRLFSEKYKYIDLSEFCGKIPEVILNRVTCIFNNLRGMKLFKTHFYETNNIEREWEMFKTSMEAFYEKYNEEKIKGFEKNKKIRKVQTFIKKKASKWYILMNNLLQKIKCKT